MKNRHTQKKGRKLRLTGRKRIMNTILDKQIVACFLQMLNTVKLYHWRTRHYATHKATDQLYSDLGEKVDEFVEVLLGKNRQGDRSALNIAALNFKSYPDEAAFNRQIEIYKEFLITLSNKPPFTQPDYTDLLAIRDEILALLNQFLYLMSLH
jgi:DNA-binding ferritin-like protein